MAWHNNMIPSGERLAEVFKVQGEREHALRQSFLVEYRGSRKRITSLQEESDCLRRRLKEVEDELANTVLFYDALHGVRFGWKALSDNRGRLWFFIRKEPLEIARNWKAFCSRISPFWIDDLVSSRDYNNPLYAAYQERLDDEYEAECTAQCSSCGILTYAIGLYHCIQEDHENIWQLKLYALCLECKQCNILASREENHPFLEELFERSDTRRHQPAPY